TWPMTTFLYLTCVLLASSPSAVSKLTVIWGPAESQFCTTIENPTSAAAMGTSQTSETRTRRCLISGRPAGDSGWLGLSDIVSLCIPDQSRIEAHRSQHRQYDNQAEEQNTQARLDGAQCPELHQCCHQSYDQDVEHRPVADGF